MKTISQKVSELKELFNYLDTIGKKLDRNIILQVLFITIFVTYQLGNTNNIVIFGVIIDGSTIEQGLPFAYFILLTTYAINAIAFVNTSELIDKSN